MPPINDKVSKLSGGNTLMMQPSRITDNNSLSNSTKSYNNTNKMQQSSSVTMFARGEGGGEKEGGIGKNIKMINGATMVDAEASVFSLDNTMVAGGSNSLNLIGMSDNDEATR